MSLLVHPTSSILLDEPEAFLHPPQARRLAEIVASEVPGGCQVIVATHNDAFVRALLNASGERVVLARIVRVGSVNRVTVLDPRQLKDLWTDPLLKTSDILSALFHDAAVLCEGDSDARFYGALMDATRGQNREADIRLFHFGGKDRIAAIARALRLVEIPVVAVVDIDILSDREKFFSLFEAMGGKRQDIEQDVRSIIRQVAERKGEMTAIELSVELKRMLTELDSAGEVTREVKDRLNELGRVSSNWGRVKHDGFRALDAQVYGRVANACKSVGLLINPEGELEGFCREIPRTRKPEWLARVLQRKLNTDPSLADARAFADQLRDTIRVVMKAAA